MVECEGDCEEHFPLFWKNIEDGRIFCVHYLQEHSILLKAKPGNWKRVCNTCGELSDIKKSETEARFQPCDHWAYNIP